VSNISKRIRRHIYVLLVKIIFLDLVQHISKNPTCSDSCSPQVPASTALMLLVLGSYFGGGLEDQNIRTKFHRNRKVPSKYGRGPNSMLIYFLSPFELVKQAKRNNFSLTEVIIRRVWDREARYTYSVLVEKVHLQLRRKVIRRRTLRAVCCEDGRLLQDKNPVQC
jgi:hypothetical protein